MSSHSSPRKLSKTITALRETSASQPPRSSGAANAVADMALALAAFGPHARRVEQIFMQDPRPQDDSTALEGLKNIIDGMVEDGNRYTDPMRDTFARLGDKWSTLLLILLRLRPMRLCMLNKLVDLVSAEGVISRRILVSCLRALERNGLIERTDLGGKPRLIIYSLTPLGGDFVEAFRKLMRWTHDHLPEIRTARQRYAERYESA